MFDIFEIKKKKRVVGMDMLESSVPDIQVGENTIRSSVSISYSIK